MKNEDRPKFRATMEALMACYYKPELPDDALRAWWDKLIDYDFDTVNKALDEYTDMASKPPIFSDITSLCRKIVSHQVSITAKLPTPYEIQAQKAQVAKLHKYIGDQLNPSKDPNAWAHRIMNDPASYPESSVIAAKKKLNIK